MKNILLLFCFVFLTYLSFAIKPPAAVQKAFSLKFENATDVKWGKENALEYEAKFIWNGIKSSANFSAEGTWLETESMIPVSELPAEVVASITKKYPDTPIIEAARIERAGKDTLYEVVLKFRMKKQEVFLDEEGVFQE
jgi:hypothetical protein